MTIKVNGDFEKIKAEMKQANKELADSIKEIKKPYRRTYLPHKIQEKVDVISTKARIYSVSKVLPVRLEGIVINYKLYKAFMKKLKGFEVKMFTQADGLFIQYWKLGTLHQGKGLLKLYNMSQYFEGFKNIPDAELVEDGSEA